MTKEQILDLIDEWFKKGIFTTITTFKKTVEGASNNTIEKYCNERKLAYTSIKKILYVGDKVGSEDYTLFQQLCNDKRIMDTLEAKIQLDSPTLYGIHKEVGKGNILRYEVEDAILYIK